MADDALRREADELMTQARDAADRGDFELADKLTRRGLGLYALIHPAPHQPQQSQQQQQSIDPKDDDHKQ